MHSCPILITRISFPPRSHELRKPSLSLSLQVRTPEAELDPSWTVKIDNKLKTPFQVIWQYICYSLSNYGVHQAFATSSWLLWGKERKIEKEERRVESGGCTQGLNTLEDSPVAASEGSKEDLMIFTFFDPSSF